MNAASIASLVVIIICNVTLLPAGLFAQYAPPTAPEYLHFNNNPRSLAVGEATVALQGYAGAGYINPATIGIRNVLQVSSDIYSGPKESLRFQSPYYVDRLWNATRSIAYRVDPLAAELRWKTYNNVQGYTSTEDRENGYVLAGSFAYTISDHLRLGVGLKYMYLQYERERFDLLERSSEAQNFSVDLGVFYHRNHEMKSITLKTSYGWSLTDFGSPFTIGSTRHENQQIHYSLPMKMRLGTSIEAGLKKYWYGRPLVSLSLLGQFSKTLARRDDEGYPRGPFGALFSSWGAYTPPPPYGDGETEITLGEQIFTHGGIELSLADLLYARMGYINRPNYAFDVSSYGLGLDLYYLAVDITRLDPGDIGPWQPYTTWKVTARIPLGAGDGRNFWPDLVRKGFN